MKNLPDNRYTLINYSKRVELYFCGDYLESHENSEQAIKAAWLHKFKQWFTSSMFDELKSGYIEALLWSNPLELENGEILESADQNGQELSKNALQLVDSMLWRFIADNAELINENMFKLDKIRGGIFYGTWELFGHDLALSQNGHGTGFRCRGYGIIGDKRKMDISRW